jgi:DNA-binding GntR family transcriptional regulator
MSRSSTARFSPAKRPARTAERIFNRLVEAIVTGTLESGQPMREAGLAKQWGVSRTPMREAVRRAAEAGLLILRRNRAPLVRAFTQHDIDCVYQMREVLEALALEEAWDHILPETVRDLQREAAEIASAADQDWGDRCLVLDDTLHRAWIDHCRNPWLTHSLQRIWTFIRIFQRFMAGDPEVLRRSYREHCAILQALASGDRNSGVALVHEHIRNSCTAVKERLEIR